jgi:NADPH2:quinone reductase
LGRDCSRLDIIVMKGILVKEFGEPNVLQIENNLPLPEIGSNEILIQVFACGVNPVDTYIRSGQYQNKPVIPYIPGKDGAGIIYQIGDNVTKFKINERVYFLGSLSGSYAQYVRCDIKYVFHLPNEISFLQGACLGTPAFTAYRALFDKARGQPGDKVFIHGASGGVGMMALEMAKAMGMTVVGTAGTPEGIEVYFPSSIIYSYYCRP